MTSLIVGAPAFAAGGTAATAVFGQGGDFTANGCDSGGITADSLCHPYSTAMDPSGNLYIADYANNRVLEYDTPLARGGNKTADRVFGQSTFDSNACNRGGSVDADTLCGPVGVALDANGNLFVADYGNNRVLEYDTPLATSGDTTADHVFGQSGSFVTSDANKGFSTTADTLSAPQGVAIDAHGNLYVGDTNNSRVLEYDTPLAGGGDTTADHVLGQGSFTAGNQNQGGSISADTLNQVIGVAVDAGGNVFVADYGNNRLLEYNTPFATGGDTTADHVFGQSGSFTTGDCNQGSSASADTVCVPQGVALDAHGNLYVGDYSNNRVLFYKSPLRDSRADKVYGQGGSFTSTDCNKGGPVSASTLCGSVWVGVGGRNVFIADYGNNRVLVY